MIKHDYPSLYPEVVEKAGTQKKLENGIKETAIKTAAKLENGVHH